LFHFDFGNARRMGREHALAGFAVGNAANGEGFVETATFAADHDPGKNLDAFLVTLNDAGMHANAVTDFELGGVSLELFLLNSVDNPVHNESSQGVAGGADIFVRSDEIASGGRAVEVSCSPTIVPTHCARSSTG